MRYRAEIDGLRAVAVVPVIFFHAGFDLFSGGFVGVDIFFVISGYLITSILIADFEEKRFSILKFYERRARRILPALFFVMLCCIPFSFIWMLPAQMADFSKSLVAVSFFVSNILFWSESGYFAAAAEAKPLLHTWSLAVEEQYYILFPIFLLLTWRLGKNRVFWLIVVFATISLAFSEWGWRNMAVANFYLAPSRVWELFAGSIAAFIVLKRGVTNNNVFAFLGLVAIIFSIFVYSERTPFPSIYSLVPVLGVVLIVLFAQKETYVARILSVKPLVTIGLISYSAYLWHQPIFAFAKIRASSEPPAWIMLMLCALSILLAVFSWKYVERPFRGVKPILEKSSKLFAFSLAGIVFFSIFGLYGYAKEGFKQRFTKSLGGDVGHLQFHQYVDERYHDCKPDTIANEALYWGKFIRCKQSKEGTPSAILLGDSHAEHLFPGMAESFIEENIAFYISGGNPYSANPQYATIFDELINKHAQKTIFLTMHYVSRLSELDDLYIGFSTTIEKLQSAGHTVVLLGDVPRYETDAANCLYRAENGRIPRLCRISSEKLKVQENTYHSTLKKLSDEYNVVYLQISAPLCDSAGCSMVKENTIFYRDAHHLNIPGSILIGRYIVDAIKQ